MEDWPDYARCLRDRIEECKLGFPGIRSEHLTVTKLNLITEGQIFILDRSLFDYPKRLSDEAPIMYRKTSEGWLIEGIGQGLDLVRDPDRVKFRWMDMKEEIDAPNDQVILRVDCRPDLITGGPGYYYFYKAFRDNRWPTRPGLDKYEN